MRYLLLAIGVLLLSSCGQQGKKAAITVRNDLEIPRQSETIEVTLSDLQKQGGLTDSEKIMVTAGADGKPVASQLLDLDQDGSSDLLIFQADLKAGEEKSFVVRQGGSETPVEFESRVDARFVPQRKDDFAWENDRIAYRMYGPALQATGEISSGVDVWVKKVPYLILQKWYDAGHDAYHKDSGEGLDYYKAGPSRGCGGIAVWHDGKLYPSKNYTDYKIIANGPVRSVFELSYAPWEAAGTTVSEVKRISLDAGHNLNHFESRLDITGNTNAVDIAVGIVKREGEGKYIQSSGEGYLAYWEPAHEINGSTGCGIVINPGKLKDMTEGDGHYLAVTGIGESSTVSYYAGAGWSKSPDFDTADDWFIYVKNYAMARKNPVEVNIKTSRPD